MSNDFEVSRHKIHLSSLSCARPVKGELRQVLFKNMPTRYLLSKQGPPSKLKTSPERLSAGQPMHCSLFVNIFGGDLSHKSLKQVSSFQSRLNLKNAIRE